MVDAVNGAAGISFSQMQGMDIESMLMAVQGNRANLLEEQLMSEMKNVQAKNEQIAGLNSRLTALTGASQLPYTDNKTAPETALTSAQRAELNKAKVVAPPALTTADTAWNASLDKLTTKGELDKAVTELKGQVDSLGSTQQMDMLRLQSLSNKRNEAFDLMTNFMKKFADKRDAIIGNMR
jgi:hypothetical protein